MTIYSALSRGTTDTCGLGTGRTRKVNKGGNPRSFTIGNLTFRTLKEASLALGYEQSSLSNILRSGKERARANLLRRALKISAERENAAMNAVLKQRS